MDSNVYETPKSEITSNEQYFHMGGWLRCFQVLNIISVVIFALIVLAVGGFAVMGYYTNDEIFDVAASFVESLPGIIFAVLILKYVSKKAPGTPAKINKFLECYVISTILIYAALYYLHSTEQITEKPISFWGSVIYAWIWITYFKKSKRVNGFYGENAK